MSVSSSSDSDLFCLPTVTVGIPFYNSEKTLADAIRSVFAQSYTNWELFLIDDGSTDRSLAIASSVQDPRVKVISDGVNRGRSTRLNDLAQLARGRFLARMDADDLMLPERLERQVAFLEAHPHIDLVGAAMYTIGGDNQLRGWREGGNHNFTRQAALEYGLFGHPTVTGKREWFQKHPYDPNYARVEDRELWCRTCSESNFALIQEPLLCYREVPSASFLKNYLRSCQEERQVLRKYGPEFVGRWRTRHLLARSYLKQWVYRLLTPLGLQPWIVAKRSQSLSLFQSRQVQAVIDHILRTRVPGLSSREPKTARAGEWSEAQPLGQMG